MNRFNMYQSKLKEVNRQAAERFQIEINPFQLNRSKINKSDKFRNGLSSNFRKVFDNIVERRLNEYHSPVMQDNDGQWLSAYDLDQQFL